jgi:lipopolysaccharide assembly protein A
VKILRTIIWVLIAIGFLIFAIYNWQPVELTLWQNLVLETKVPVLALLAFAVGFLPMWAYHRSVAWGLNRRVRALETSLKNTAIARQAETSPVIYTPAADSPVDKSGKIAGEPTDPFSTPDGADGGAGE